MAYSPGTSFNYSIADPFAGQFGQVANRGMDFAQWAADKGFTLADLARTDRNTQQAVENAFRQEQANRAYELERERFGLEKTQADRGYGLQRDQFGLVREQSRLQNELARQEEARRANEARQAWFANASAGAPPILPQFLQQKNEGSFGLPPSIHSPRSVGWPAGMFSPSPTKAKSGYFPSYNYGG